MATRDIRRPGYRALRGYYPSTKVSRALAFESRLERDHFLLLDADPRVERFDEQPVTISFAGSKRTRRYTPDCHVIYRDGINELVEVKYTSDLAALSAAQRDDMREAHVAAAAWCEARGWRFVLRTDRDIVGPALERAQALRAFARCPSEHGASEVVVRLVSGCEGIRLDDAENAMELRHLTTSPRRAILHLVWRGVLRDEPFAPPSAATRLYLATVTP